MWRQYRKGAISLRGINGCRRWINDHRRIKRSGNGINIFVVFKYKYAELDMILIYKLFCTYIFGVFGKLLCSWQNEKILVQSFDKMLIKNVFIYLRTFIKISKLTSVTITSCKIYKRYLNWSPYMLLQS